MMVLNWSIFLFGVNLLELVRGLCLQNTSSTCYVSFADLRKHVTSIRVTDLLVPDKNNTNHRIVCRLYEEYRSCKYTGFTDCYNEKQNEMNIIDEVFDPICSKAFHDFVTESHCIRRLRRHYKVCQRKKDWNDKKPPSTRSLHSSRHKENRYCNNTKDYIMCLYSVTALGCSLDVAEDYFSILNQSLSTAFKYRGQLCILNHPLTAVSTTSASRLMMSHALLTTPSSVYSNLASGTTPKTMSNILYKVFYGFVCMCVLILCVEK